MSQPNDPSKPIATAPAPAGTIPAGSSPATAIATAKTPPPGAAPAKPIQVATGATTTPDPAAEATLANKLKPVFTAAVADLTKTAETALESAAKVYAPLIARQALLQSSSDPEVKALADRSMRHLKAQALMNAAALGIPLEQRREAAFFNVFSILVSAGIAMVTGGAAGPIVAALGVSASAALKKAEASAES